MNNEPAIRITGLTKYYGKYLAVDHIDLEIYRGEIFGFLGPNGAGKTTTLLMLTTVIKPSEGSAVIMGYNINSNPDRVREVIGMAFQEPKLYWVNTPWEILIWHAKVCGYGGTEARKVVREVLESLNMWDARNKRAFQLSGGMKKRIEIAKLFIQRPEVAIFDEPTSQIDVSGKHRIWNMIKSLRDDGSTIILATNELYEADILSDRVGIIHKGRIVALGSPAELKDMIPGGDILEIVVDRFVPDALRSKLESIPEVSRLSVANGMLRLYLNKAEEILPNVIQLLMSNDIRVKSVNMREPTLNDVFLHFTGTTIKEAEEGGN